MSSISRKELFSAPNKFQFVQQNYRVFLLKDFNAKRNNSVFSPNKVAFEWENVGLIDLIYFDSDEFIKCPICLDSDLLVPKISNCGHIYCWPCIIKLMNNILKNEEYAKKFKCPICFSNVFLNELVSLRYQIVQKVQLGSVINLCLLFRNISSPLVHFKVNISNSNEKILLEKNEKGAQFQRIGLISNQNDVLLCDLQMLRIRKLENKKNSSEEISYIEECISIIENALELRGVAIPEHEIFLNDTFGLLFSQYNESELLEELEYSFINSSANCGIQSKIKDFFYFYQLFDGQLVFLEPFYVKVLQTEFGSIENLPKALLNVSVTSIKELNLNDQNMRKYKFLNHIPIGSRIHIVGIDLTPFITTKTKKIFEEELGKRLGKKESIKQINCFDLLNSEIKVENCLIDDEIVNFNRSLNFLNEKKSSQNSRMSALNFPVLGNEPNSNRIKTDNVTGYKSNLYKLVQHRNDEDLFPPLMKTS
ncbi:uncharacterized protein cubi_00554 [Cryptosporidium ubiquitum]|uniref:RING-type domain-containing protein n=1 Tax=Cryptosporidium ubiquitum TaxID=857276 RepID=A0A1J4ME57_9CRYT|nr:uncharacterized protein cubi_00554 [Cryptosporidium ubiquitum]OII71747.1 hypothetical protein cubi_00554 [Cryptosporidium ubiquitum]